MIRSIAAGLLLCIASLAPAQVGPLVWSDEFEDLDDWIKLTGNGAWGWGNGELQYYAEDNVAIAEVPGEPGNFALHIQARAESGPGIVDQWGNPLGYTSGRVMSKSKVSVRFGMIETRVLVPDLEVGGWPAVWMLGTTNYAWPRSGEFDIMEMGLRQEFRDRHDTHNGGSGLDDSGENDVAAANAIFYSDAAVNPGNPSGAASLAFDPDDVYVRPFYDQTDPLAGRFVVYRLYWDDTSLRFTVVDDGVESDLFESPFTMDAESDEFLEPFYFVANLAIGGSLTDAWNLGDPASGVPVSMPLPADMYVDYIRVYEWNGQGDVHLGPPDARAGRVGLFTEETPVTSELVPEVSSEIYVWEGTLEDAALAPFEGTEVLSWRTTGLGWFGAGIMSVQPVNLFDFGDGHLNFRIKIPANVTFEIGVIDAWGNQSYVTFPAFQETYGLQRDGEWGQASIPVSAIRGTAIDLRMMSYSFVILERNGTPCEFAIDDVYWDSGVVTSADAVRPRAAMRHAVPNPFNARTEIRFELAVGGTYEVVLVDSAGRRVRSFRGLGRPGVNTLQWDGRDDAGRELASGVYHARLDAAGGVSTEKVVLVK